MSQFYPSDQDIVRKDIVQSFWMLINIFGCHHLKMRMTLIDHFYITLALAPGLICFYKLFCRNENKLSCLSYKRNCRNFCLQYMLVPYGVWNMNLPWLCYNLQIGQFNIRVSINLATIFVLEIKETRLKYDKWENNNPESIEWEFQRLY